MPNYGLGAKTCWPLSSSEVELVKSEMVIFPNPASTIFYINNKIGKKKELYNTLGVKVLSTYKDEIEVMHLSKGVYYLRCENEVKKIIIE